MAKLLFFMRPRREGSADAPPGQHYSTLQAHRTALINAWTAWLATNPPADDIEQEIEGTVGAMRGLAALVADHRPTDR